jgi:hypothetical protein
MRPAPQCRQRQHQRRPRSASAAAGAGEGAQGWEQHQQQHQQQHQHKQQHEEDDEGTPVTAEEMAEAEQILQDFLEGMGAAGEISRPEDADLPGGRLAGDWFVPLSACHARRLRAQLSSCWPKRVPSTPSCPAPCLLACLPACLQRSGCHILRRLACWAWRAGG